MGEEKVYISVFDKTSGKRKTSYTILGNLHGKTLDELKKKAAADFPDDYAVEQTAEEYRKTTAGDLYWNGTEYTDPPGPSLDELKAAKLVEVNDWTAEKITGGFMSEATGAPVKFDSDTETQLTLQGIALNAAAATMAETYSEGIPVRGYAEGSDTKQVYHLNAAELMQVCADLSTHIMKCKEAGWAKQNEVKAAATAEDLGKIVLD